MSVMFLAIPILTIVVLLGVAGLVLLVVGIIRRSTPMWVCGIIGAALAGLGLVGGVAVGLYVYGMHGAKGVAFSHAAQARPGGSGDYVRSGNGQATARIEGVEFTVLAPGGGGSRSSVRSKSGPLPGTSETRHEVTLGNVAIIVEKRDGGIKLSVNGTDYGPINPGDSVLINEARDVLINGQPRSP